MLSPAIAVILALCGVAALLIIQPLIFQLACALVGEKVPGYFSAAATVVAAFVASLVVGFVWSFTGGLILAQISTVLAVLASFLLSMCVGSVVYSATLRIALTRAFGIAVVGHMLGLVFTAAFVFVIRNLWLIVG